MPKYRRIPDLKPEEVPDWATPEAWKETERICNLASKRYYKMPKSRRKRLERAHSGSYILIACHLPLRYVVCKREQDAGAEFKRKYPRVRMCALLQVGCV